MKVISFNINGLNAFDSKGNLVRLISSTDSDIYCFQETKISQNKIDKMHEIFSKFPDYIVYSNICTIKNGYAGVATLVKKHLANRIVDITTPNILDGSVYKNFGDGRIVSIEFDSFYIVNAYVINSGNKHQERIAFDNAMIEYINSLEKPCIYCGDMNVCSTSLDYWGDYDKAIDSMPGLYSFEIDGFANMINECHLVDTYRLKNSDKQEYTWYSPIKNKWTRPSYELRHGWRIDYFLVSEELEDKVENSKIYEGWNKSDHSPIELTIIV